MTAPEIFILAVVLAAALSACMTWAIRPLLLRHVLANPNARSSHRVPTPQGGGIAVVAATLMVAGFIGVYTGPINFEYNQAEEDERVGVRKGIEYTKKLLAA